MKKMCFLIMLTSACSFSINAQLRGLKKPKIGKPKKTISVEQNSSTTGTINSPEKNSPAKSEIQMADIRVKTLNKHLENGDFDNTHLRETTVKDEMEELTSRVQKIEKLDPEYDVQAYKEEFSKFESAYTNGVDKHKQNLANIDAAYDERQEANSPVNKRRREVDSWLESMVFSKDEFKSSESVTQFTSGDIIMVRAKFSVPVKNVMKKAKYFASFEVDGERISTDDTAFPCEGGEDYLDIEIVRTTGRRVNRLIKFNKLPIGKHEVTMYLEDSHSPGAVTASVIGTFELNVTEEGKAKWKKIIDELEYQIIAANNVPPEGMKNATICNDAIRLFKDEKFEGNPYKTYIESDKWYVEKTAYGVTLSRTANVIVCVKLDDKICYIYGINVKQDYNNGNYGKSYYGGIGIAQKVLCSKLK